MQTGSFSTEGLTHDIHKQQGGAKVRRRPVRSCLDREEVQPCC